MCWDQLEALTNNNNRVKRRFYLNPSRSGIYLTKQESECAIHLLMGKTYKQIAQALQISHRTVEIYIRNMRIKLGCHGRSELISLLINSEFLKEIE